MKKTLYVSDLDGTLLNSGGVLSDYSRHAIEAFFDKGVFFTCATGRTLSSVNMLLEGVKFSCPAILSDGLFIFDMIADKPVKTLRLHDDLIRAVERELERCGQEGFLYCLKGTEYGLFYKTASDDLSQHFIESKRPFLGEKIFKTVSFSELPEEYVPLYFVIYHDYHTLSLLQSAITGEEGAHCLLNRDVYSAQPDIYFMNILSDQTSKSSAIDFLRDYLGANEVVAFGDNFNDLPMLMNADRCYVPENGIEEAKAIATEVIPSCDADAVVRFIEKDLLNR
ncbi:MAG: HAD hydrolase family protein [Pantoea sp.]|uniref:HAD family hydrolase n=1 Tax=Pantoea sp. TaxID=69393 RepID=UPI0023A48B3B|nr:HAD hydrolase family protein [Pantoea sp.]MDE1188087.1 HAD hydrolase family protein [Pantoea sp.]